MPYIPLYLLIFHHLGSQSLEYQQHYRAKHNQKICPDYIKHFGGKQRIKRSRSQSCLCKRACLLITPLLFHSDQEDGWKNVRHNFLKSSPEPLAQGRFISPNVQELEVLDYFAVGLNLSCIIQYPVFQSVLHGRVYVRSYVVIIYCVFTTLYPSLR